MKLNNVLNEINRDDRNKLQINNADIFKSNISIEIDPDSTSAQDFVNCTKIAFKSLIFKQTKASVDKLRFSQMRDAHDTDIDIQEIFDEKYQDFIENVSRLFLQLNPKKEKLHYLKLEKEFGVEI